MARGTGVEEERNRIPSPYLFSSSPVPLFIMETGWRKGMERERAVENRY